MFLMGFGLGVVSSAVVALILLLTIGDSDPFDGEPQAATPSVPESTTPVEAAATHEDPNAPRETYNVVPTPEDFSVTLKTTSKQCFGSAGCNVTVEPKVSYGGGLPLDPGKSYAITYEVRGSEDGAIVQTMKLTNQTSISYHPISLSTSTSEANLTVEVSDVEEQQ
ncbi:hypothetical protein [Streptomyces lavendulocolor]|uniref:hypothetical protein n=1 Tax=Streptomyces lavendulocolor TaxID=67316 RepID=UPI003C30BA04